MSYFGWRKDQSVKKPRHADGPGRRLMPAELAEAAAAMGLPVSSNRYEPETTEGRNKRAVAYKDAVAMEAFADLCRAARRNAGRQAVSAQSPTSYPWCAKYYEAWQFGTLSCYYTSYEQCRTTIRTSPRNPRSSCLRSPFMWRPTFDGRKPR